MEVAIAVLIKSAVEVSVMAAVGWRGEVVVALGRVDMQ